MTQTVPAPRLQLRWMTTPDAPGYNWCCIYELVMPIREGDIRAGVYENGERVGTRTELALEIAKTKVGGNKEPCRHDDGSLYPDTPFRDGCHASWDSQSLGGLPVYVIAIDGTAMPWPKKETAPACGG